MSELGDKERRFVEDQRRITVTGVTGPDLEAFTAKLEELARKDALLAEAAEVLREISVVEPRDSDYGDCLHCQKVVGHEATCPWLRAKPLLDKLGREGVKRGT